VFALFLLAGIGLGMLVEWRIWRNPQQAMPQNPSEGTPLKQGPWGDLYYVPFTIAAPDEILPVRKLEENGTHWFFRNFSRDDLDAFLRSAKVPDQLQNDLLDPACLKIKPDGIDLMPRFETLVSLPPNSRKKIYQRLALDSENNSEIYFLNKATLQTRFGSSDVSEETITLFKKLCCEHGNYLVFSGLPSLIAQIPKFDEKVRFMKALTRQKTLQLRLRITQDSNINSIAKYWSRGCYATDIRTMLESFAKVKGGAWVGILDVLPPLPASELYFFPIIQDNPLNGPPVKRDCHWTSFNFFRDVPDNGFSNPDYILHELKTDYYPAPGDPMYGDLVLLIKPDGSIIHSAIYLADDIVFTKNGNTVMTPWMLSTVNDLLDQYSFQVQPSEHLTVTYYRNKLI